MNIKNAFFSFASIILGSLLGFFGILMIQAGTGSTIAMGVISLLIGIVYICASLLKMFQISDEKGVLTSITALYMPLGFLVYYLVFDIIGIVQVDGNLGFLGWVIYVVEMVSVVAAITFEVVAFATKEDKFRKVRDIFIFIFMAFIIIGFVFANGRGLASLNDIALYSIITLVCYCALVFSDMKQKPEAKEEVPAEEAPVEEEAPAEEVPAEQTEE